jgi:ubiquinone/menaquinone biosynthesis C-methylase UbiE
MDIMTPFSLRSPRPKPAPRSPESVVRRAYSELLRSSAWARRFRSKYWYRFVAATIGDAPVSFLNYGYLDDSTAGDEIPLLDEDETHRLSIQLYHHVASAVELTGRRVLEVGCGRGGGSSYIMRYLKPGSVTGMDMTVRNVRFCARTHSLAGMGFVPGDAEALPFADASFDAVVNVESSHCYGRMDRFVAEVARVLRPAGSFLFADFRSAQDIPDMRETLVRHGLQVDREHDITANVLRALTVDSARRQALVGTYMPSLLRHVSAETAGVDGSGIHRALATGLISYWSFVLHKHPAARPL